MSEIDHATYSFLVEGLRIVGIVAATAPSGVAAIAFRLSDGSRVLAYADDDPQNPTGVALEWIPHHNGKE